MSKKKILVCIDMQNDFITGSLANKEAEKIVPRIQNMIKEWDGEIIFTRDTHGTDYLHTNEGKHLPIEHCIKGTYGHQICQDLLGWKDAIVIDKPTFGSLDLVKRIEEIGQFYTEGLEIHLVGVVSSICVISNALLLKTYFPEDTIVIHRRCCADLDKKGQDAAMLVMERCHVEVLD